MKPARWIGSFLAGVGVLTLIAWPVYAHCGRCVGSGKEMVKLMESSQITLASATATAEEHAKGKALAAYCGVHDGALGFKIFCLAEGKFKMVKVNASGKVTAMKDVRALPALAAHEEKEHEHEHEHDDDDDNDD